MANTAPITPLTPNNGAVKLTNSSPTADTDHTGTNSLLLFTAGTYGSIVDKITLTPTGTNAAQVIRIYYSNDAGTTKYLRKEFAFAATTTSDTVAQPAQEWACNWALDPNDRLYVSQNALVGSGTNSGMVVIAEGGDY